MAHRYLVGLVWAFGLVAVGCGGGNGGGNPSNNPNPVITSLSQSTATAGGTAFTLTVNGSGFISASTVEWNGSSRTTSFTSTSVLTAQITAADIASTGTAQVTVLNPAPGGGTSSAATFTINLPPPTITSLSPSTATAGGAAFTLTVNGTGFVSGSTVQWNGTNRTTSFTSATVLTAQITAADIVTAGNAQVTVVNPAPGGGTSSAASFTISQPNNPQPTISSISPARVTEGGTAFTLTVNGTGFISASTVNWNGSARPTAFTNSTVLTAQIPAADIATAGNAQVTVVNPAPGGGTSTAASLPVTKAIGIVQEISLNPSDAPGNNASAQSIPNSNGRYVLFVSMASDLVANDTNGQADLFVRDTCVGVPSSIICVPSTIRVSLGVANAQLIHGQINSESISEDGRFVVYGAISSDIGLSGNTNEEPFVRDTCIGQPASCTPGIAPFVALDNAGNLANASSDMGAISRNGRIVAFRSQATNLVPFSVPPSMIYARDTCLGATNCTPSTMLVSVAPDGSFPTGLTVAYPSVNADGRFIAFAAAGMNEPPGGNNNKPQIFVRDTCFGAPTGCVPATILVSVDLNGNQSNGLNQFASISADGRYVVFNSTANNMVTNHNTVFGDVFLRDTCLGPNSPTTCKPTTTIISLAGDGMTQGNGASYSGPNSISADGRFVTFYSFANNLLPPAITPAGQTYVRDTCNGGAPPSCAPSLSLVSIDAQGNQVGGANPSISGDGHYVTFESLSGIRQVFLALTGY